jgi:hypothetical protein
MPTHHTLGWLHNAHDRRMAQGRVAAAQILYHKWRSTPTVDQRRLAALGTLGILIGSIHRMWGRAQLRTIRRIRRAWAHSCKAYSNWAGSTAAACASTPAAPGGDAADTRKYAAELVALSPDGSRATNLRRSLHVGFSESDRPPPQATAPLWANRRHDGRPESSKSENGDLQHLPR